MVVINQSWTEQMSMLLSGHILRAVKLPKVYPFPFSAFVPFGHHPFPNVGSPLVGGGKSPYAVLPLSSFLFPFFYISFCPFPPLCLAAATRCRGVLSSPSEWRQSPAGRHILVHCIVLVVTVAEPELHNRTTHDYGITNVMNAVHTNCCYEATEA